jgi:hypothetical protein
MNHLCDVFCCERRCEFTAKRKNYTIQHDRVAVPADDDDDDGVVWK